MQKFEKIYEELICGIIKKKKKKGCDSMLNTIISIIYILFLVLLCIPKLIHIITQILRCNTENVEAIVCFLNMIVLGYIFYKVFFPLPHIIILLLLVFLYMSALGVMYMLTSTIIKLVIIVADFLTELPANIYDNIYSKLNYNMWYEKKEKSKKGSKKNEGMRVNKEAEAGLKYFIELNRKNPKYKLVKYKGE